LSSNLNESMCSCLPSSLRPTEWKSFGELWQKNWKQKWKPKSSRAFNLKIAQFSKLFLAKSLLLFDRKSRDFNGSETTKRRNFDKSAHSENFSRFSESINWTVFQWEFLSQILLIFGSKWQIMNNCGKSSAGKRLTTSALVQFCSSGFGSEEVRQAGR
jgi:hypothetical protein